MPESGVRLRLVERLVCQSCVARHNGTAGPENVSARRALWCEFAPGLQGEFGQAVTYIQVAELSPDDRFSPRRPWQRRA
jgi:hypothetical protein